LADAKKKEKDLQKIIKELIKIVGGIKE